jgi:hypothetical protein
MKAEMLLVFVLLQAGCARMLPSAQTIPKSRWHSYDEAKEAFDRITPNATKVYDLQQLGFDPTAPNAKSLTYLDVIQRFLPTQAIGKEDLDQNVRECIAAHDACRAIEIDINEVHARRFGNVCLDVFGFRRKTHETGWRFVAFLVIRDDLVVYKLCSGAPVVDRIERRVKPLGPLQELDNFLLRVIPDPK